jgi:hypothetical protein
VRSLTLLALLFVGMLTHAEEQSTGNNSQGAREETTAGTVEPGAEPRPGNETPGLQRRVVPTEGTGTRNFIPTEKISADNSVPFPVDI